MIATWNPWLVALSVSIAIFASYATLSVARRIVQSHGRAANWWACGGALALGLGIWSMHFVGMLAFRLPIPLGYDLALTGASVVPAMLAAGMALYLIRRRVDDRRVLVACGAIIGTGIVAMHYTGMAAMRMVPPIRYDLLLVAASWLVATGAATAALGIAFLLRTEARRWALLQTKLLGAAVMGLAIAGMHYTGMAAAHFDPDSLCLAAADGIGGTGLAVAVGLGTVLIMGLTVVLTLFDARLQDQQAAATARLRAAYAELEDRVEARTEELKALSEELARSNAELERFAYIVSHDLKEPLRTITGFSGLLGRKLGDETNPEVREYLDFIVGGARHMQELIDGLLAYSRAGAMDLTPEPVELEALLERTLSQLALALDESGARVTHDPLPRVQGDRLRLGQVLQNLIGNAVKFRSEQAPRVHIGVRDQGREWLFSVADNGIGIDPRHQQRIFEVFQRLHRREDYPGTGIGLAICKKIIERHGGRIWLESAPGAGTTFYFTLPKAA